jgi:hypothetical protein
MVQRRDVCTATYLWAVLVVIVIVPGVTGIVAIVTGGLCIIVDIARRIGAGAEVGIEGRAQGDRLSILLIDMRKNKGEGGEREREREIGECVCD